MKSLLFLSGMAVFVAANFTVITASEIQAGYVEISGVPLYYPTVEQRRTSITEARGKGLSTAPFEYLLNGFPAEKTHSLPEHGQKLYIF